MKPSKNLAFYEFILKVQAISKIGLTYSKDAYALENYEELSELSSKMLKNFTKTNFKRPQYFARDLYPTPNVSVRMIVFNEKQEVLLVKEKVDQGYTLPGGWADLFESPVEAITKECLQEAGADVKVTQLTGVYHYDFQHRGHAESQYVLVFKGVLKGPLKAFGHEILDVQFFPIHRLPKQLSFKIERKDLIKMISDAQQGETFFE
ncbi:MAG: NUDIX hydrolase N-terminal domain-containing protein [Bacilli bacterium]